MSDYYLCHHGILGQKWGVRRYQNEDGSLTAAGRVHYGVGEARSSAVGAYKSVKKKLAQRKENTNEKPYKVHTTRSGAKQLKKYKENAIDGSGFVSRDLLNADLKRNEKIKKQIEYDSKRGSASTGVRSKSGILIVSGKQHAEVMRKYNQQRIDNLSGHTRTIQGQKEMDKLLTELSKDYEIHYAKNAGYFITDKESTREATKSVEANKFYINPNPALNNLPEDTMEGRGQKWGRRRR